MNDVSSIIDKIRTEIESYSGSSAKNKKLLFNNITPDLITRLQKFLQESLSNENLFEQDDNIFIKKLYKTMGWKYFD